MDDDDDEYEVMQRAAALKGTSGKPPGANQSKADKDRAAEEAFRKAAEADAQKDKRPALNSKPSGWLGGWFGGKGKEGGDMGPAAGTKAKPIKARLGEDSSFVFDPALKKWVNKNATGDAAAPSAPTPPPPRGPPSRQASGSNLGPGGGSRPPTSNPTPPMGGPPSAQGSRNVSPSLGGTAAMDIPFSGGAAPPMTQPPAGLGPPSRPGTGMSGMSAASSIDDLLGAPQARKGGTIKKAKKRNAYVDIMAK